MEEVPEQAGNWIDRLESALAGRAIEGVDLVPVTAPPIFDAAGRRAALTPFFAAFMWAGVVFRETVTGAPLDPLALLLRLLALVFSVRALLSLVTLGRRARQSARRARYGLSLCDEGLMFRTPRGDFPVQRRDIVDVRVQGQWQTQSARRWADVYVLTRPDSGRVCLTLPPLFDRSPGALAERLMRWRGAVERPETQVDRAPAELASKLFDEVAAGARPPGTVVLKHGRGWMSRGPFATILFGIAVLDGFLRLPASAREAVGWQAPVTLLLALGLVPTLWFVLSRLDISYRKGIALIMSPGEMLMRTRAGVHRVRWSQVKKLDVIAKTSWSLLQGQHEARSLLIERKNDDPITYVESHLGAPVEMVIGLGEAYRKGLLP